MRDIKFRFWTGTRMLLDVASNMVADEGSALIQYTGLKDNEGTEIYDGDILNICFTSGSGEFIHDGIYVAYRGSLGSLEFDFKKLAWESSGHNQYSIHSTLCERYGSLSTVYADDRVWLITPDQYNPAATGDKDFPFNNQKELSFNSRYFKVIGNIYENPDLIESANE